MSELLNSGEPKMEGRYLCWTDESFYINPNRKMPPAIPNKEIFLTWEGGRWYYKAGTKLYGHAVVFWIGPIPSLTKP